MVITSSPLIVDTYHGQSRQRQPRRVLYSSWRTGSLRRLLLFVFTRVCYEDMSIQEKKTSFVYQGLEGTYFISNGPHSFQLFHFKAHVILPYYLLSPHAANFIEIVLKVSDPDEITALGLYCTDIAFSTSLLAFRPRLKTKTKCSSLVLTWHVSS